MTKNNGILFEINSLLLLTELDRKQITDKLKLFENEIQKLLERISSTANFHDCEACFKELEEYQLTGAKLLFKYDFEISDSLEIFVRDFDRMDDSATRKYLYELIKAGRYFQMLKG